MRLKLDHVGERQRSTFEPNAMNIGLATYAGRQDDRDTYKSFLDRLGLIGHGFGYGEIVRPGSHRKDNPPRRLWDGFVPTFALAHELRARLLALTDARGLNVAATFRPRGGAAGSLHKKNKAIDLDLLSVDRGFAVDFYRVAVELWCAWGDVLDIGLGLYCAKGQAGGMRAHIDTGYRCRTWQKLGGVGFADPPAAVTIARGLGLRLPAKYRGPR